MKNINEEEDEETRFARLRFEEILHTLTVSIKGERLMELKKRVAKAEIDRLNKILEKHLYSRKCSLCYGLNN